MWRGGLMILVSVAATVAAGGCGSSSQQGQAASPQSHAATSRARPAHARKLVASTAPGRLPAPLSGVGAAAQGSSVLVIGGVDAGDVSTTSVSRVSASGDRVSPAGPLVSPLHDVAAATVGGKTLVFGGGAATTVDLVQELASGGSARVVGHLPGPRSDATAVAIGGEAFVVGGYDGVSPTSAVPATNDGSTFKQVASLPVPVRYTAPAAVGPTIYALGGELADGTDTNAIQAIDTRTGHARIVARLPTPVSHASAVALGGRVYLLGGRVGGVTGSAIDRIVSFDPSTGRVTQAGHLPMPVTNAAAAVANGVGVLAGGLGRSGTPLTSIVSLHLK